jgi:hypothetical protein
VRCQCGRLATAQRRMGDLTWKVRVGRVLTEMAIHDTIVGWLGNGGEEVRREVISGVRVVEEVCGT